MKKRWQPLPMAVASTVLKSTWNKQHPAPKAVAYLWVWALLDRCSPVTRRELAAWAGWSEWKARGLLDEVSADFQEWQKCPPKTAQKPPRTAQPDPVISDSYSDSPPTYAAHSRARSSLLIQKQPTDTKQKDDLDPVVDDLWIGLKRLRGGRFRLTPKTRKAIKARIKDTSPEEVAKVFEWWQTSQHSRAKFLRQKNLGIGTILKPDLFFEYLAICEGPKLVEVETDDPFAALAMARSLREGGAQ